jgi:hypothetical protein
MRLRLTIIFALALPACSPGDLTPVAACRGVVDAFEKYPSTISVLHERQDTKSFSREALASLIATNVDVSSSELLATGLPSAPFLTEVAIYPQASSPTDERLLGTYLKAIRAAPSPGIKYVALEYDVDNGAGVPKRETFLCRFLMSDAGNDVPLFPLDQQQRLEFAKWAAYPDDKSRASCCHPQFSVGPYGVIVQERLKRMSFRDLDRAREEFLARRQTSSSNSAAD